MTLIWPLKRGAILMWYMSSAHIELMCGTALELSTHSEHWKTGKAKPTFCFCLG
jgi:hypothetical protein